MDAAWDRGLHELSETFALRRSEFEFLLNTKLISLSTCRYLFTEVLDTDRNELVDKFETMCMMCLCSALSNSQKVELLFDLFNLNDKGYLTESEISLLILSVVRVVEKIDAKWPVPAKPAWLHVVKLSLQHFAKIDKTGKSLRKPELVVFASETVEVARYLDAWRGHASQVLVAKDEQWKDVFFPCNDSAIVPLREWVKKGLPPAVFIRWRRRTNVGDACEQYGHPRFLSHSVSVLRTSDKKKLYHGNGILGLGHLKQRMLADRWFLNAVTLCCSRAETFLHLFASTGQEETVGRYNTRFYEGMGWRSVFIDDRFPCDLLCRPIFSTSSDTQEACMMVLEKGLAKYMGSYGNIGLSSDRHDCTLFGMRLLTGGHVFRVPVLDYMWKNARNDIDFKKGEKDGAQYILELLQEGSMVSFGRSESMALYSNNQKKNKNITLATIQAEMEAEEMLQREKDGIPPDEDEGIQLGPDGLPKKKKYKFKAKLPPHGRVYPVIACYDVLGGDKFVHLRDSFGELLEIYGQECNENAVYQKDDRKFVDERSGYCRWVKVPLEDLPVMFDTIFVSRYPDGLKQLCSKLKLPQWRTDIVKGKTSGPAKPARFTLNVLGHAHPVPPPPPKDVETRLSKLRNKMEKEMVVSTDIVSQDMDVNFDYDQFRYFPSATRAKQSANGQGGGGGGGGGGGANSELNEALATLRAEVDALKPVDMALTVSSNVPWAVASTDAAGAKLRLRIVPSLETVKYLRSVRAKMEALKELELAIVVEREEAQKALLAVDDDKPDDSKNKKKQKKDEDDNEDKGDDGESKQEKEKLDGEEEDDEVDPKNKKGDSKSDEEESSEEEDDSDDESGSEEDDSEEESDDEETKKRKKKEAEEDEKKRKQEELDEERMLALEVATKEKVLEMDWFEVRDSGPQSWISKSLSMYVGKYHVLCDVSYDMDKDRLYHLSKPKDTSEAPWLENRPLEIDTIWLQVSSVGRYEVRGLDDRQKSPIFARNVTNVTLKPARWPFAAEHQEEVASRALTDILTDLRREVDYKGAELMTLTQTFTEKWGMQLKSWRQQVKEDAEEQRIIERELKRAAKAKKKKEEERLARKEAEKEMEAMRVEKALQEERKKKFNKKGSKFRKNKDEGQATPAAATTEAGDNAGANVEAGAGVEAGASADSTDAAAGADAGADAAPVTPAPAEADDDDDGDDTEEKNDEEEES
jgi:hypothetical protein